MNDQERREQYLLANMRRWRRVAELEHAKHCTKRHDCSAAVEREYQELLKRMAEEMLKTMDEQ